MSYILDALKKLEHEKARKKRGTGMSCISGELFADEHRPTGGGGVWKVAVVVAVASLATFGATWFLLRGDGPAPKRDVKPPSVAAPAVSQPAPVAVPSQLAAAPHSASAPVQPPVSVPAPISTAAPVTATAAATVAPVEKAAVPVPVRTARRKPAVPVRERSEPSKDQMATAVPGQVELQPTPPPVDLRVSGIAWQDTRSASRAVINGFLLQEGNVVSGAKITEILPDRVRFSLSGRSFDVPLVASGASAAGK
ncbi:hypothetical protein [Geobacter sp. SVR]|uniref:hypothetical protein n=1 Tax=Geobacter sp. SVR TaxID=2495594 RepID=UPI00143EF8D4|nr:hypothetical protein [Geobacter sp. SVR]BCS55536.1 hypothetical protein GSVR_38440 [Geobacter sp. SVR]GCF83539.1 hypothetical protein GSbR_01390 [Geobacter sp. SVR]